MRLVMFRVLLGSVSLALVTACATAERPPANIVPAITSPVEAAPSEEVRVDERIELFMIIFRLAGAQEFNRVAVPAYGEAIDRHFGPLDDHEVVRMVRRLRAERGISYNAVPDLAVLAGPLPELSEREAIEQASDLDPRWDAPSARTFLDLARDFAQKSNAAEFFRIQRPLYDILERRMRNLIANEADLDWVRQFYGGREDERFIIVPAMLAGGGNYGPRVTLSDGSRELYAVVGIGGVDEDENPVVSFNHAPLLVHEFGHSFVNPLVYEHKDELKAAGELMLATSGPQMRQLGYPEGAIVLHESIIRAGVARYKLAKAGPAAAERELDRQRKLGFIWIDDIYELLARYEANRGRYPTFASFYPELKLHLDGLAIRMPSIKQSFDARRPKIISSFPAQDATNVDPAVGEIRLQFDRPMAQRWGFNGNAETQGEIPEISGIKLEEADRVMVIGVTLKPNTKYEMPFFEAGDPAPRSKDGVLLAPYTVRFTTGAARRRR